jgi:glutamine amidotransferase
VSGEDLAVLDYGAGNLKSVQNALLHLGAGFFVTSDPKELAKASGMIFPGVGAAGSAMAELARTGLDEAIRFFYRSGRKMLGICIGCQVIFDRSEESDTRCLGLLPGTVRRFPRVEGLKIPHMGWNTVHFSSGHPVLRGIAPDPAFYFVHSYYPAPAEDGDACGWTEYGVTFPSAVARGNLIAFQFHLEKSGAIGLRLLANFLEWRA